MLETGDEGGLAEVADHLHWRELVLLAAGMKTCQLDGQYMRNCQRCNNRGDGVEHALHSCDLVEGRQKQEDACSHQAEQNGRNIACQPFTQFNFVFA